MGPYSEERQCERARGIASLLLRTTDPAVKKIWEKHLNNLARNESDYNARVVSLYYKKRPFIWT